ncbi:hypothetical protein AB0910_27150 [Streptomyces sp. NPDC047002]|uniref:hypothetical protein n=1 Tax=Streptomyces sp. NPDC047002 TaxID=3155475 RepID=UPI0034551F2C
MMQPDAEEPAPGRAQPPAQPSPAPDEPADIRARLRTGYERLDDDSLTPAERDAVAWEISALEARRSAVEDRSHGDLFPAQQNFYVSGGANAVIHTGGGNVQDPELSQQPPAPGAQQPAAPQPTPADRRLAWHFSYADRILRHYTALFWVGLALVVCGGALALGSAIYSVAHPGDFAARATQGSVGALFGVAGTLMSRKAREKEQQVAEAARANDARIAEDERFDRATALLERLDDPSLREKARMVAAMKQLDIPVADDVMTHLLGAASPPPPPPTELPAPPRRDTAPEDPGTPA